MEKYKHGTLKQGRPLYFNKYLGTNVTTQGEKKSLILVILHTIHQKSPAETNFKMLLGTQYLQHMAKEPQTRKRGKTPTETLLIQ